VAILAGITKEAPLSCQQETRFFRESYPLLRKDKRRIPARMVWSVRKPDSPNSMHGGANAFLEHELPHPDSPQPRWTTHRRNCCRLRWRSGASRPCWTSSRAIRAPPERHQGPGRAAGRRRQPADFYPEAMSLRTINQELRALRIRSARSSPNPSANRLMIQNPGRVRSASMWVRVARLTPMLAAKRVAESPCLRRSSLRRSTTRRSRGSVWLAAFGTRQSSACAGIRTGIIIPV
jgi:hypothetical protein